MRFSATLTAAILLQAATALGQTPAQQSTADPRLARADSHFLARDYRGAIPLYASVAKTAPLDNRSKYRYALSLGLTGQPALAAPLFDELAPNRNPIVLFNAGSVHAALGHADTAFAYLGMATAAGFMNFQAFASDTGGYAKLRGDRRYAAAEQRLRDALTPCVNNPDARKFDFWVGEWTVVNNVGQTAGSNSGQTASPNSVQAAGSNSVQKILSECVVFENWTSASGGQGKSLNAFNRGIGKWQQFYVDQFGNVTEYRDSEWVGSSLRFFASSTTPQGQLVQQRMTFTPIDPNTVRQHGEVSTDGGKTWTTSFDLRYLRKK